MEVKKNIKVKCSIQWSPVFMLLSLCFAQETLNSKRVSSNKLRAIWKSTSPCDKDVESLSGADSLQHRTHWTMSCIMHMKPERLEAANFQHHGQHQQKVLITDPLNPADIRWIYHCEHLLHWAALFKSTDLYWKIESSLIVSLMLSGVCIQPICCFLPICAILWCIFVCFKGLQCRKRLKQCPMRWTLMFIYSNL